MMQTLLFKPAGAVLLLMGVLVLVGCGGGGDSVSASDASSDAVVDATGSVDEVPSDDAASATDIVVVDADGNTVIDANSLTSQLDMLALGSLSDAEIAGLMLMREEEKLARDVYTALYAEHGSNIFQNIADSEQSHTDAVLSLLERYALNDPVGDNALGIFTDVDLQQLYDTLVALGTPTLMDALFVGARIEELAIADIQRLIDEVVDNDDILLVYNNLLLGSRNHLRAFNRQIESNGWSYTPEYISQAAYDDIVNSPTERPDNG